MNKEDKQEFIKLKWSLIFIGIILLVAIVGWIFTDYILLNK